jgi:hypothetical protein
MVVTVSAKKGFGLEYEEEESQRRIVGVVEGSVEYYKLFESYREMRSGLLQEWQIKQRGEEIRKIKEVLDPDQIREFVTYALAAENETTLGLGTFVSKLVQNSCQVGNRQFQFDLTNYSLNHFLINLDTFGLEIEIVGGTGSYFAHGIKRAVIIGDFFGDINGFHSEDSSFKGNFFGRDCGERSRRSTFVGKSFGDNCGRKSVESTFIGEVFGPLCGNGANRSTFTSGIFGEKCGRDSENCVYRTWNEDTLDQLFKEVPKGKGNHIDLVTSTGGEIKRYSHYW